MALTRSTTSVEPAATAAIQVRWCATCQAEVTMEQPECSDGHAAGCPDWFCVGCGDAYVAGFDILLDAVVDRLTTPAAPRRRSAG